MTVRKIVLYKENEAALRKKVSRFGLLTGR